VDRSSEEEWEIVPQGIKNGDISETRRLYGVAQTVVLMNEVRA
jgi:hypothetical protein